EIPNVTLSEDDYEKYCQKLPNSLQRGVTFSNQWKVHDELRNIKNANLFTDTFFTAARCYTNKLESKIVKKDKGKLKALNEPHNLNQSLILHNNEFLIEELSNYSESNDSTQTLVDPTPEINLNQIVNQTSPIFICSNNNRQICNQENNNDDSTSSPTHTTLTKDFDQAPSQQQHQTIYISIVALMIICVFTIKNNIDNVNTIWQFTNERLFGIIENLNNVPVNIWNANNLETENTDLKIKNAALEAENMNLKIKNADLKSQANNLEIENTYLKIKNAVLEPENTNLKIENTDFKSQNVVLEKDNTVFKSKNAGLEKDNNVLKSQNKIFEKDNENFKKVNENLNKQIEDSKLKIKELNDKSIDLQLQLTSLKEHYNTLNNQFTDLLTKNKIDEETIKKLNKEIKEINDEKDKVENDLL
ncbi:30296_t:CDS:2, partial [Gigaspora margarita]